VTTKVDVIEEVAGIVLSKRLVPLLDRARIYACGITPYDVTHLGHAATFVWVDVLCRVLRLHGVEPELCRNVTDVDDVLDAAARRAGERSDTFAAVQQFEYERDMDALRVRVPEHEPRAHSYVRQVVRLAQALIQARVAYQRGGTVYFRGHDMARRANLPHDQAVRLAAEFGGWTDDPAKDDSLDVAVWQASGPGETAWDSPWGQGRPGWHAECVAMALSTFGVGVDVHTGGADLAFPHHAYHAAMAEALTGVVPYARAWLHVGTVHASGAKMAKSAGNLVLVRDLLNRYPTAAVRLMILDRPWAASWEYQPGQLERAAARVEELYRAAGRVGSGDTSAPAQVRALLQTDLDVPAAVAVAVETGGPCARMLITTLGLD
jgi:cysteinyl-tRNA synthetase